MGGCSGVQLVGDALPGRVWGEDGLHELQCDPFDVILDGGSHAHRIVTSPSLYRLGAILVVR